MGILRLQHWRNLSDCGTVYSLIGLPHGWYGRNWQVKQQLPVVTCDGEAGGKCAIRSVHSLVMYFPFFRHILACNSRKAYSTSHQCSKIGQSTNRVGLIHRRLARNFWMSKGTFLHLCQGLQHTISRHDTQMRKALPCEMRVSLCGSWELMTAIGQLDISLVCYIHLCVKLLSANFCQFTLEFLKVTP